MSNNLPVDPCIDVKFFIFLKNVIFNKFFDVKFLIFFHIFFQFVIICNNL